MERSLLAPVISRKRSHCHPERSRRISPFFIFNSIFARQFSDYQPHWMRGFAPARRPSFFAAKERWLKKPGQSSSFLVSPCQSYNQQNNSFRGDCPGQSPLHSNKFCRLTEVVELGQHHEPGAFAWPLLVISLARCYIAAFGRTRASCLMPHECCQFFDNLVVECCLLASAAIPQRLA